jgi:hypothetical protein
MDFDRPLSRIEGYLVYTTMMDYLETFIHEYTVEKKGEYPSLRITADMLLNLLVDVKKIELSDIAAGNITDALYEFEKKLMDVARKPNTEIFDTREAGLFIDDINNSPQFTKMRDNPNQPIYPDEPLKPFTLSSKADKDWLRSTGIIPD